MTPPDDLDPGEIDRMAWALCPVFLAADECYMPQIINGRRPGCRQCPAFEQTGNGLGVAGCRIVAEIAARIALGEVA